MKIYTKTGDTGETGLPGGGRVPKDATVTEVCGTVDELNTALGLARAARVPDDVDRLLDRIQSQLFDLGAEVARLGARRIPAAGSTRPMFGPWKKPSTDSTRNSRRCGTSSCPAELCRRRVAFRPGRMPPGRAAAGGPDA